jgi:hypothetical protein
MVERGTRMLYCNIMLPWTASYAQAGVFSGTICSDVEYAHVCLMGDELHVAWGALLGVQRP